METNYNSLKNSMAKTQSNGNSKQIILHRVSIHKPTYCCRIGCHLPFNHKGIHMKNPSFVKCPFPGCHLRKNHSGVHLRNLSSILYNSRQDKYLKEE